MSFADVGDAELFYTDSGARPGQQEPPLLLIHGWTCDSHDWLFQLEPLASTHRVIAVDLRGHGRSSVPADGYTAQQHAAGLTTLLAGLGIERVVVIGHSLGGSVAAAMAVEYPELVRAMVAVEPAYGQDPASLAWLQDVATQFGDEEGNELAVRLMGATEPHTPDWLKTWHARRTLGTRPDLLKQTFWAMYCAEDQISGQPRSDVYLAGRTCPTLAFHRLPAMAAWEQSVMRHPCSRVVSWEGAGHWLHQERPVEFNAIITSWLGDVAAHDAALDTAALDNAALDNAALDNEALDNAASAMQQQT